jgi:hypothetical protein
VVCLCFCAAIIRALCYSCDSVDVMISHSCECRYCPMTNRREVRGIDCSYRTNWNGVRAVEEP